MSVLEMDRERVIQSLCAHYANDHLTTHELEARFDLAYKATSLAELEALVARRSSRRAKSSSSSGRSWPW